jgi:hypothetical protein
MCTKIENKAAGTSSSIGAGADLPIFSGDILYISLRGPREGGGKTKVLYIFKIVLTFLKIVLLIVPINCKKFC